MSTNHAFSMKKSWSRNASIAGATAFALFIGGVAVQAADGAPEFAPYDETDSPNPYPVTEGLVYYKAADMGWYVNTAIEDVDSLAYTVADSSSYAPSYQLVITSPDRSYARLVWEPYQQEGGLNGNEGEYTNLEDGIWWSSRVANPAPGSQSQPMSLSWWASEASPWSDITVFAIDVKQGTTTESTSVVTKINFNGHDVPLGNADATPFNQDDINAAVAAASAPLNDEISGLQGDLSDAQGEVSDLQEELSAKQNELADTQAQLAETQADLAESQSQVTEAQGDVAAAQDDVEDLLGWVQDLLDEIEGLQEEVDYLEDELDGAYDYVDELVDVLNELSAELDEANEAHADEKNALDTQIADLQGDLADAETANEELAAQLLSTQTAFGKYEAKHHTVDGTNLGASRALLSAVPVVDGTVGVKLSGTIATKATNVTYKWFVGGVAVPGANGSTFTVPAAAKNKTVAVVVTGTAGFVKFAVQSNSVAVK